jgi:hypothetical protein
MLFSREPPASARYRAACLPEARAKQAAAVCQIPLEFKGVVFIIQVERVNGRFIPLIERAKSTAFKRV